MKDEESKETMADEKKESPAKEKKEQQSGSEGVKLPEEFQRTIHAAIEGACDTEAKCDYASQCISEKRRSLMEKGKKGKVAEYSSADEPAY